MNNDIVKAGKFRYRTLFVNGELVSLLEGFVCIFGIIVKSGVRLENNEKIIRKEFIRYLKNIKYANSIEPFKNYSVDAEVEENDGFLDLKITPRRALVDPMDYFSIECKRLDNVNQCGKTGLNARYVKDGINRYKEGKYTTYHGCNGMFGFIVADMNVLHNTRCINIFLEKAERLKRTNIISGFENAYLSSHTTKSGRQIALYHLMFDFSSQVLA